jgi:hypothetical protein
MRTLSQHWTWVTAVALVAGATVVPVTDAGAHGGDPSLIHACVNMSTASSR